MYRCITVSYFLCALGSTKHWYGLLTPISRYLCKTSILLASERGKQDLTRTLPLAPKILCLVRASQTRSHDSQVLLADILDNLPARRIADALSHIILLTNTFNILYRSDCGRLCAIFTELEFALYLILSHFITLYHTLSHFTVLSGAECRSFLYVRRTAVLL